MSARPPLIKDNRCRRRRLSLFTDNPDILSGAMPWQRVGGAVLTGLRKPARHHFETIGAFNHEQAHRIGFLHKLVAPVAAIIAGGEREICPAPRDMTPAIPAKRALKQVGRNAGKRVYSGFLSARPDRRTAG